MVSMDVSQFRSSILQGVFSVAGENYKENSRITNVLDDKAQKTGAFAGAFLAAGFAFIKSENFGPTSPLNKLAGLPGLLLLALCIGLLLLSTILALRTMWVRAVPAPMSLAVIRSMAEDLLNLADCEMDSSIQENYFRDQSTVWESALEQQKTVNADKAKYLRAAQLALTGAIVCGAVTLLEILSKVIYYRLS